MGRWKQLLLSALLVSFTSCAYCTFAPNVTVLSCASKKVVVQLENGADDGLIYIQGRGLACSRTTARKTRKYEFDFELCDIKYDTKFRVVVQKKPMYQTGYDKVIPVMCIVDTSDLYVSGVVYPAEALDTDALNKTIRPTVTMRVLAKMNDVADSAAQSAVQSAVREVTLQDEVQLNLRLDDPYLHDFDIKVKDCRAEMIDLVEDGCSKDEELFPNFEKNSRGDLASEFLAFQPTHLDGQTEVDISFLCNVEVCKGECHRKVCGEVVGGGRKKRESGDNDDEDAAVDDVYEEVTCATKLRVRSPSTDTSDGLTAELQGRFCAEKLTAATVMTVTLFVLVVSWLICACAISKLRNANKRVDGPEKTSVLRRMSEKNINFARSVGRRLSTMLNLPVGYDVHDPKMTDCIPETEVSPPVKRRDSVTVSEEPDVKRGFDNQCYSYITDCDNMSSNFVRRRFVDSSVQTDPEPDYVPAVPSKSKRAHSPAKTTNKGNPFAFITSISIKSAVSKARSASQTTLSASQTSSVNEQTKYDNSLVKYSADDLPRVRDHTLSSNEKPLTARIQPLLNVRAPESPTFLNDKEDSTTYVEVENDENNTQEPLKICVQESTPMCSEPSSEISTAEFPDYEHAEFRRPRFERKDSIHV